MQGFTKDHSVSSQTIPQGGKDIDFIPTAESFALPDDMGKMTQAEKRQLTICNLFCNHHQSVSDIVRVLDETYESVVRALLKHEVVFDRRREGNSHQGLERRKITPATESAPTSRQNLWLRSART